jgi:aromatic-amino-acid transaminase
MFDTLQPQNPDALLQLIGLFRADPRADKLDLGVGVYRDNEGHTIVLSSIKEAERRLLATQDTKAYLGVEGDARFVELTGEIALGRAAMASDRVFAAAGHCAFARN